MKPRTFRRVVLLGSLGAIVFVLLFGYFVVRPWQNQRQLEAMRDNGREAYANEDYVEAVQQLGRYIRSAESPEPELLLEFARARAKVQTADLAYIIGAINSYREYLREVPEDTEAAMELLPLMNAWRMYVEARSLAEGLINDHGIDDLEVLRELRIALIELQVRDNELEPVLRAAYEHEDSRYGDAINYYAFLNQRGRSDEVDALIDERLKRYPDRVDEQLLVWQHAGDERTLAAQQDELASLLGLDSETGDWDQDAPDIHPSVAQSASSIFNWFFRTDLSTSVQVRSARINNDIKSVFWAARRLYWSGDYETLHSLSIKTSDGEPDPDVLGYRYLAAVANEDEELKSELESQMETIVLDRRADAWLSFIEGLKAHDEERFVDARIAVQAALDVYPAEPSFRLLMGDIQRDQGRFNEAVQYWTNAHVLANGELGGEDRSKWMGWTLPLIRVINAYSIQGRLVEALDYIEELERIGLRSARASVVVLRSKAELARRNELPREYGRQFVERWAEVKDDLTLDQRARISPYTATILATMGERDQAQEELLMAIETVQSEPSLLVDLVDVDVRYELGVAKSVGIELETVGMGSPTGALTVAGRIANEQGNTQAGLRIIENGLSNASEDEKTAWERVRAQFLDSRNDPRATAAWDKLLEENPNDVALHYVVIESNAYSNDLDRINSLIDRITELTSTAGKTIPSRLRLARANAMVTGEGKRTRANRDRAMEIVRSIVVSEPGNIRARNMLARLLAIQPEPGLPENERFAPDRQGAIDQYVTLSRQLSNRGAQTYLLEAADLAFELNDDNQVRSLLREFSTRFNDDWATLPFVAERFENLGDLDEASAIYQRVVEQTGSTSAALSLADLLMKQGQESQSAALLNNLQNDQRQFSPAELLRLAQLTARSGNQLEAEQIAKSGEEYGLSPGQASVLYARYARINGMPDEQIAALREATEVEPGFAQGWKLLIQRLLERGDIEEARSVFVQAEKSVELDDELVRLGMLTQGPPESSRDLLDMPGIKESPRLRNAVELVDAYEQIRESITTKERVQKLTEMIDLFQDINAVQLYAVRELSAMRIDPGELAKLADRAHKHVPGDSTIMAIAAESYLLTGQPERALRVVGLWRANSIESSIIADAISARANIQLKSFADAELILSPYIQEAIQAPGRSESLEVIDAFSFVRLQQGEDPADTAERIRPLIKENPQIRTRVWLGLAANAISDHEIGASWITEAEALAADGEQLAFGNAWVSLAFNHQQWDREYAQSAIEYYEQLLDSEAPDLRVLIGMARSHLILARASTDPGDSSDQYASAVEYMMRADEADPGNVALLLDAARFALEGGLHSEARSIYEQVLTLDLSNVQYKAMVMNNLAMSMLRTGYAESEADQVREYAQSTTQMIPDVAPYWGTRGWVELDQDDTVAAEESFRSCIRLDPSSVEGWVGLAIALHRQGQERAEEHSEAMARVRAFHADAPIEDELLMYLEQNGLGASLNEPSP